MRAGDQAYCIACGCRWRCETTISCRARMEARGAVCGVWVPVFRSPLPPRGPPLLLHFTSKRPPRADTIASGSRQPNSGAHTRGPPRGGRDLTFSVTSRQIVFRYRLPARSSPPRGRTEHSTATTLRWLYCAARGCETPTRSPTACSATPNGGADVSRQPPSMRQSSCRTRDPCSSLTPLVVATFAATRMMPSATLDGLPVRASLTHGCAYSMRSRCA